MASPNISFDSIPSSIRKPGQYMEFNLRMAVNSMPANVQRLLLIGQRLTPPSAWQATTAASANDTVKPVAANGRYYICVAAGTTGASEPTWPTTHGATVTDGTVTWMEYASADASASALTQYNLASEADAKSYFGEGSQLHLMAKAAFKANPYLQLYGIAMADSGSNFASGTMTVSGTATGGGWVRAWIGDVPVEITFASTDTASAIATRLAAAINAKADLSVTATVSTGTVTLRAKNAGTIGNQLKTEVELSSGKGIAVANVTPASGSTDPDIQGALDKIVNERFQVICPGLNESASLVKVKTHLDTVSGPLEQKPGICACAIVDTVANATTLADALNHGRTTIGHVKSSRSPAFSISAAYAAVVAAEEDPAKHYDGVKLSGITAPVIADRTTVTDQSTLLLNGITPFEANTAAELLIVRSISTYQSDISILDITSIRTLDYVRDACKERVALRFARSKLSSRTPAAVRSELLAVLKSLEALEIVDNVDDNADGLICEVDSQDPNRLNAKIPVDVVNGLHVFAGRIDMIL